jgi:hypothetical protein
VYLIEYRAQPGARDLLDAGLCASHGSHGRQVVDDGHHRLIRLGERDCERKSQVAGDQDRDRHVDSSRIDAGA